MAIEKLEPLEKEIIRSCIIAVLQGGLIDDFEFQTRLAVEKHELSAVLHSYPNVDDSPDDSVATLSINNCLNEICFGLSLTEDDWLKWFDSISKQDIIDVYKKWTHFRGWKSTGIR